MQYVGATSMQYVGATCVCGSVMQYVGATSMSAPPAGARLLPSAGARNINKLVDGAVLFGAHSS